MFAHILLDLLLLLLLAEHDRCTHSLPIILEYSLYLLLRVLYLFLRRIRRNIAYTISALEGRLCLDLVIELVQCIHVFASQVKIHLFDSIKDVVLHEGTPGEEVVEAMANPTKDLLYGCRVRDHGHLSVRSCQVSVRDVARRASVNANFES